MIFRVMQRALVVWVALWVSTTSAAEPVDKAVEEGLRKRLSQPAMGLVVKSVEMSEMPGIYAVQFNNGPLVYATADGSYFIVGDLHQVGDDGFVNLTDQRRDQERKELVDATAMDDMIVFPAKGEKRAHIYVFTDVTCFYCQKLHLEVPELNKRGVEVRYLAYPRAGLDSPGYRKLATAWCSADQQDTLTKLKAKKSVDETVCDDNPIAQQFQLGQVVGVRGTPAIVTQDGKLIPGYQAADELTASIGLK